MNPKIYDLAENGTFTVEAIRAEYASLRRLTLSHGVFDSNKEFDSAVIFCLRNRLITDPTPNDFLKEARRMAEINGDVVCAGCEMDDGEGGVHSAADIANWNNRPYWS